MPLTQELFREIVEIVKNMVRQKLASYRPESSNMPFHYRLLGRDRMALFSFIHSLNTAFGTSIFEPVAEAIARASFTFTHRQYSIGDKITERAQIEIQQILNELTMGGTPDKQKEIERIRRVCNQGKINHLKTVRVDLFVKDSEGVIHLFDIKTAKPNISNFKDFKRTLLEWIAIYLYSYPTAMVNSYIAIPYNPYEPEPYERWTIRGMLDLARELKVAEEFWDYLGGVGTYSQLLDCFETAGMELRSELDEYFSKFKR